MDRARPYYIVSSRNSQTPTLICGSLSSRQTRPYAFQWKFWVRGRSTTCTVPPLINFNLSENSLGIPNASTGTQRSFDGQRTTGSLLILCQGMHIIYCFPKTAEQNVRNQAAVTKKLKRMMLQRDALWPAHRSSTCKTALTVNSA